jgi:hypothetical protein
MSICSSQTQNPEPPKGDFFFFLLPHAPTIELEVSANLGGFFVLFGVVPTAAETPAAYKRRIFGCNRCKSAANSAME